MPATYASLSRANLYTYTDGMVICGPPQLDPNDSERETVTNPRLIIEVVYPEAEAYVRGDKFAFYREIESLEEYVIVSQRIPQIETFFRQSGSTWLFTPTTGLSMLPSSAHWIFSCLSPRSMRGSSSAPVQEPQSET